MLTPSNQERPLVMGILNVTPDSFFDGGEWYETDRAIARGHQMIAEGADIVDVGGESTRPGAEPVAEGEELRRVLPVVEALSAHVRVSVDTTKANVANAAVARGASLVNDVSAQLWAVAAEHGVGWVAMHSQDTPAVMQRNPHYGNVVDEVSSYLLDRAEVARAAGVAEVWIDPGIGFGKNVQHNVALLGAVDALADLGYPVLVGTSRKSFLGVISPLLDGSPAPIDDRGPASLATATWALQGGASMIRVHDVAASVQAAVLVGTGSGGGDHSDPVGAP
jgi:dihydropteroate synthase